MAGVLTIDVEPLARARLRVKRVLRVMDNGGVGGRYFGSTHYPCLSQMVMLAWS